MSIRNTAAVRPSAFIEQLRDLSRYYPTPSVTPKRNTFTGATIFSEPPALTFMSAGAAAETNKLAEFQIEYAANGSPAGTQFGGPGHTIDYDFPLLFSCSLFGGLVNTADAANVGADAWIGLEIMSAEANIPTTYPTAGNGWVSLRRSVKDPKNYSLQVRNTAGNPQGKVDFTVPYQPGDSLDPLIPEGHMVALFWDPWAPEISAYVNGTKRASLGFAYVPGGGFTLGTTINAGLVAFSGTQSAAAKMFAQWSGIRVTNFRTDQIGAGI